MQFFDMECPEFQMFTLMYEVQKVMVIKPDQGFLGFGNEPNYGVGLLWLRYGYQFARLKIRILAALIVCGGAKKIYIGQCYIEVG